MGKQRRGGGVFVGAVPWTYLTGTASPLWMPQQRWDWLWQGCREFVNAMPRWAGSCRAAGLKDWLLDFARGRGSPREARSTMAFTECCLHRPNPPPTSLPCVQGAFASRMSHSCTPNCQAIIMACGGRLTIALYTLRHVHEGGWVGGWVVVRRPDEQVQVWESRLAETLLGAECLLDAATCPQLRLGLLPLHTRTHRRGADV